MERLKTITIVSFAGGPAIWAGLSGDNSSLLHDDWGTAGKPQPVGALKVHSFVSG